METPIFEMSDVKITYGFRTAVESLSLSLKSGGSLGILGMNGAGKTSTIRVLLGMLRPKEGSIKVLNEKPGRVTSFAQIGFAPEDGLPPEYLSGEEYLKFMAAFKIPSKADRSDQIEKLLQWCDLPPKKRVGEYSKGMQRKILLAAAFLGNPTLLILDEPLNGLDPLFIIKLRERLDEYVKKGGSLLLCSHILAEVEKTCNEVAILHQGKLLCHEPVPQLVKQFGSVESAFAEKVGKA